MRDFREGDFGDEATEFLSGAVTLRRGDGDGNFDELIAEGVDVHLEMMSDGCLWISLGKHRAKRGSSDRVVLWVTAAKRDKLTIGLDDESA
jgi:hypothetical protein